MAYADYIFYQSEFKGTALDREQFSYYSERATEYIARRLGAVENDSIAKKACCAIADCMLSNDNGGGVVSERVGDVQKTYANGISNTKSPDKKLFETLCTYYNPVGWL